MCSRRPFRSALEASSSIVLVTDTAVLGLHGKAIQTALGASRPLIQIALEPGESHKNLDTVREAYARLQEEGIDRQAVVVAAGGGVVTDVGGFIAATYLRGLSLLLIPTTLLCQVDAAIGGKTGVDLGQAKNAVGAFHPAELILVDPTFLTTLPVAQLSDGLAEMIKIGMVWDPALFFEMERLLNPSDILGQDSLIQRSVRAKIDVVQRDPLERDLRAILNFGHTVGHALEAASGFQLSHGMAIAVGMMVETDISIGLELCEPALRKRLAVAMERCGLPAHHEGVDVELVVDRLRFDKKRIGASIRMVLPREIGAAEVHSVGEEAIRSALEIRLRPLPA